MILIAILEAVVIAALFVWIERAHRTHQDALTSIHGDLAAGWRDARKAVKNLESKIDGGERPK